MNPKPGYKSTEFWLSLITQALGFAMLLGFVSANESRTLEESLGKAIAAIFTIIASGKTAIEYIRSRTALKSEGDKPGPPGGFPRVAACVAIILGAAALVAGPLVSTAQAQPFLPWRHQVNERLKFQEKLIQELMSQRAAPAPTQPPLIVLPIPGTPKQDLPIGGLPKQDLPIGGEPTGAADRRRPPARAAARWDAEARLTPHATGGPAA
ncbi:MAG: hypothetical protein U0793_14840 [Gemmataceae bacterium]